MVRYDLDMSTYGIPGLSFMTRYARGTDADYSNANAVYMRRDADGNPLTDQKRWERDVEVKYVVQSGSMKICRCVCARPPLAPRHSSRTWMKCA